MKFEANKEFMGNLSLQSALCFSKLFSVSNSIECVTFAEKPIQLIVPKTFSVDPKLS